MAKLTKEQQSIEMINAVRQNASEDYKNQVPVATTENFRQVGRAITDYEITMNEFTTVLINKIALTLFRTYTYDNPLSIFKKGMMPHGKTIEDIWVDLITPTNFDKEGTTVDKREKPSVKVVYHEVARYDKFKVTISDDQVYEAFRTAEGVSSLAQQIMNQLYNSDEYEEYLAMRELISKNEWVEMEVDEPVNETQSRSFVKAVRKLTTKMTFMSDKFNKGDLKTAVKTFSKKKNLVLFLKSDYEAEIDVDVLAQAFNMDKATLMNRIVLIDEFDGDTTGETVAILCDERSILVYDKLYKATSRFNEEGLFYNHWLHHHQLLSISPFFNGVRLKKKATA